MQCRSLPLVFLMHFLHVASFSEAVSAHVGEPCRLSLLKFCFSSHTYCDDENICRCLPDYPVNISPHNCRKARRYGEKCSYSEECTFHDPNSYCTQLPYRSTCECHEEFMFDSERSVCALISEHNDGPSMLLPMAVGVSLALSAVLCCCFAVWHMCRKHRRHNGLWAQNCNSFFRNRANSNPNTQPGIGDGCPGVLLQAQDPLPTYEVAVSLHSQDEETNSTDELPPSYEEVMHFAVIEDNSEESKA